MITVVRAALVVIVNVDDSHVSSVISIHGVLRILCSEILWIKLWKGPELRRVLLLLIFTLLYPQLDDPQSILLVF